MLQDPPSLLTASRDRSVKLRALPSLDDQTSTSSTTAVTTQKAEPMPQDPRTALSNNDNDNDNAGGDVGRQTTLTSPGPPRPPPANPEGQEPISGKDAAAQIPRTEGDSSGNLAAPGGCSASSTGTVGSLACSLSSSKAATKPPCHGYDLTTLTLGRIADACRRDTYSFPVDLKGRGEGRAVEARAVLQVCMKKLASFSYCGEHTFEVKRLCAMNISTSG